MTGTVHCYTSFTLSYLSRARVLARTLKEHNPDWHLSALITDRGPDGFCLDSGKEDFDQIVYLEDLKLRNWEGWLFKHDLVEACTAVKGAFLTHLLDQGAEKVVYLDPDIAVFHPLDQIEDLLDEHEILLTPHQLTPETKEYAIVDNEISSLKHGTFNLGFLGIKNGEEGRACAEWWTERLQRFCYDDSASGLFTDQRWCDLLPSFFANHHLIRDPGCNVASWNLSQRNVEITLDGDILVNGSPLKFYHFTKLGSVGETMTARYARDNLIVYELWCWYRQMVNDSEEFGIDTKWWHYGTFEDGSEIPRHARLLYRRRVDLREAFPRPFASGNGTYQEWLMVNGTLGG